ncbi:MAG: hypothetical protein JNL58_26555 [Planctomyces sp.]|nr:hypothetical protein [Planctomyces sp.]
MSMIWLQQLLYSSACLPANVSIRSSSWMRTRDIAGAVAGAGSSDAISSGARRNAWAILVFWTGREGQFVEGGQNSDREATLTRDVSLFNREFDS